LNLKGGTELMKKTRVKATLANATLIVSLLSGVALTLQGCALAVVGAAAGGTLIATDRRTLGAQTEDREIQVKALSNVSNALPDTAHVNVAVFNQRVLLTGEVPDEASKQKAENIVRGVTNVESVVNELAVMPASSFSSRANDSYLEGRVKAELVAYKNISANNFKVVSERGNIYLMGLVTPEEGRIAADASSTVMGVSQVVKCYQYINPQQAMAANASAASAPQAPAATADAPTVGAIPDSGVSSRPIEQQAPAPVTESAPHSANGGATM
jgi:osmotically-inducible protein OsmY